MVVLHKTEVKRRPWCDGKQKHDSPGMALAAIRSLKRREIGHETSRSGMHGEMSYYKCKTCFKFHIGHK